MRQRPLFFLCVVLLQSACHAHVNGLLAVSESRVGLINPQGRRYRLMLSEGSSPLAGLDGYLVELEGSRFGRTIRVTGWRVPEGLHGMAAWVGVLERRGVQLGLSDRNTGVFYLLDSEGSEALGAYVGQVVLVEGYIDGPHMVRVMNSQPLGR